MTGHLPASVTQLYLPITTSITYLQNNKIKHFLLSQDRSVQFVFYLDLLKIIIKKCFQKQKR